MNEDFLRWVGEKKLGGWCLSVCVCVCVFKHFRALRPNGWSDRDRGGTDGRAETPERRWCRSLVGRRHVALGTCRRVKVYQKFVHVQCTCKCFAPVVLLPPLQATRYARLMPNLQVTCMLPQHICFCGYRSFEVQAARARTGTVYLGGVLRF